MDRMKRMVQIVDGPMGQRQTGPVVDSANYQADTKNSYRV
jgi:hypothetical protein